MAQYSTLRILARAYANGKLEKDNYRLERKSFFESLVAGKVTLPDEDDIAEKAAGNTFSDVTLPKTDKAKPEATPKKPKPKGRPKNQSAFVFAGVGLIIVVILLVFVLSGGDETPEQLPQSSQDGSPTPAVVDAPPSPLQNHIASFLSTNLWSEANLDAFLMEWQSYSDADRVAAMDSTEFSRLVNAISKKLLEERALAAIGNPETSYEKQRQLVEFANAIGIRDQRISLPDAPVDSNM